MSTVEALQGSVSPLRDKFAQRMRHDAAELETLLCDPSVSDSEKHERIRFLAHRLAGSASIFGFAVVAFVIPLTILAATTAWVRGREEDPESGP